jgi:hypothetical protein
MSKPLQQNSSGDVSGHYYTALGDTPKERYDNFKALQAPERLGYEHYNCPADVNHGPFISDACQKNLGPIASNKPWTPFAAVNNLNGSLPLPLTIDSDVEGFKFSTPPVFNFEGHAYWPTLPGKTGQLAAIYYGNAGNDFRVAPASKNGENYEPAKFKSPSDVNAPFTRLEGFSDWAATASLTDNSSGQSVAVTFATGSPLAFITFDKSDYGCFSFKPLGSWYPEGYRWLSPAGVNIEFGGAEVITEENHPGLTLKIHVEGKWETPEVRCPVRKGDTKEGIANALRKACQNNSDFMALLDVGDVNVSKGNKADFEFLLSPKDRNIILNAQTDVKVSPTEAWQAVLIARTQSATPIDPPGNIVGITTTFVYSRSEEEAKDPKSIHHASYALIAPEGAKWLFDVAQHLVCDFTKAKTKTLIVVAMPTMAEEAYKHYDNLEYGAAVLLRRFWKEMQPYAYGCPRHLTNGKDDGTGTRFGPNDGDRFIPQVKSEHGKTTVTTEFHYNLTYPAGRPEGAGGTLFCLFPHQWRSYANNTANFFGQESNSERLYWTSAGPLKLAGGGATPGKPAFTTTYTFPGILAGLPNAAGLTGAESFKVYNYPSTQAGPNNTTNQTLKSQMVQDANTPDWAADLSKDGNPRAFLPVPPTHQQRFSLGSYDWGKLVGLLGDLIPSAALLGATEADALKAAKAAIRQLNAQLGQWLSGALVYANKDTRFPPGVEPWQKERGNSNFAGDQGLLNNQQFLFYDQQWATLIPYPTGFDAETLINDHHFHYGYWLRAAAQLALAQAQKLDPDNAPGTFIKNYGATVNLIIKDIANPLRGDQGAVGVDASKFPNGPAMPFMRYFDGYFGHSWASGLRVNIIDQESVSEAMSAWTGVILWGELTGDTRMRDLGIWMYTQEMMSFYEYWMDCAQFRQKDSTYFPSGSEETVVGEDYNDAIKGGLNSGYVRFFCHVFNGYRQLVTFFGWEPIYMAGIQWMPFHGGSLYLNSNDSAIQTTLGWVWKWCFLNSKFLWDNYNAKRPLVRITSTQEIEAFVKELNASVNAGQQDKHVTEALRDKFEKIGYHLATKQDEDRTKNKVLVEKKSDNEWIVTAFGGIKYPVVRVPQKWLDISGDVDAYRPTLFPTTWEPIAWQALAAIDPNGDQVFADNDLLKPPQDKGPIHYGSPQELWAELEKAVGSPGDEKIYGKGWSPLLGQAVSYSYYWIYNICALGVRDATVSADYPFAVKFLSHGKSNYVVWNLTGTQKTVTFSDAVKVVDVPAYGVKQYTPTPTTAIYLAWQGTWKGQGKGIHWSPSNSGPDWQREEQISEAEVGTSPALAVFNGRIYLAWRGFGGGADTICCSSPQDYRSQPQVPGAKSDCAPALAAFRGRLYLFYRNPENFFIRWSYTLNGRDWVAGSSGGVPYAGTSTPPALAVLKDRLYAVWKGAGTDDTIYCAYTSDGENWPWDKGPKPRSPVADAHTSHGPALAAFKGRLYLAWKGADKDTGIYWSSSQDGKNWDQKKQVPRDAATSDRPALTVFKDRLYLAFKRIDGGIYWTSKPDMVSEWDRTLGPVSNVLTSSSPALAAI